MSDADPVPGGGKARGLMRSLLIANFLLMFLLTGPGNSRKLYLAQRRLGIANIITCTLQFWFIASTALVMVLFLCIVLPKSEILGVQRLTKPDWGFFAGWMIMVTILCMFAFMMGLGG